MAEFSAFDLFDTEECLSVIVVGGSDYFELASVLIRCLNAVCFGVGWVCCISAMMEVSVPVRRGRKAVRVVLSEAEREELWGVVRRGRSPQDLVLRCGIVLAAADGHANVDIAEELGCHTATVSKWRKRFTQQRMPGLNDALGPGAVRTITDEMVEAVVVKTLEEKPPHATHWSTRSMARAMGMSQSAIQRIWTAFGLKPHLVEEFKVSPDRFFVDKVRDITGLYLNPPSAAVVLCVDEKTHITSPGPHSSYLSVVAHDT